MRLCQQGCFWSPLLSCRLLLEPHMICRSTKLQHRCLHIEETSMCGLGAAGNTPVPPNVYGRLWFALNICRLQSCPVGLSSKQSCTCDVSRTDPQAHAYAPDLCFRGSAHRKAWPSPGGFVMSVFAAGQSYHDRPSVVNVDSWFKHTHTAGPRYRLALSRHVSSMPSCVALLTELHHAGAPVLRQ